MSSLLGVVAAPHFEPLALPSLQLEPVSWTETLLSYPPLKALFPIPILVAIAPVLVWFFRDTWRTLDEEARRYRLESAERIDYRPAACLVIAAVVLTVQEYYGGRQFFQSTLDRKSVE